MSQPPGPGPYPQQPGGGYPGQGQPPSGGFPQQQPGYGPPQGQPGGYGPPQGPPPGYPPSGGFPGGEPPNKKSPLPWILGGVGALVVIGGVILLIVLLGGGGTSDPESAANTALDYMKDGDVDGLISVTCEDFKGQLEKAKNAGAGDFSSGIPDGTTAEVSNVKEVDENTAEATITVDRNGKKNDVKFKFVKEDDEWKFCGLPGMPMGGDSSVPPPNAPSMPDMPDMPDVPSMPDMPEMPN
jgi:hypothetical protein